LFEIFAMLWCGLVTWHIHSLALTLPGWLNWLNWLNWLI